MDVPSNDAEVVLEKIEDKKDGGLTFHCSLSDTEVVHKIAQEFLPGLASACVDNTTGDIFRTPGSVAVNIRTEMVECLTKRSETFVAESVFVEDPHQPELSVHPFDIISDFVEDFALSKRNLFSRVSGWMLSEKREDKIDDFAQEMETSGFWLTDRREAVAQVLLKNVDFKNEFHCDMKFNSEKELNEHMLQCGFNPMICPNEGCNARFSGSHLEKHDSVCPFKIIPCEQKCPDALMRRDMDRHCITVCGMKLANCPFYAVGCQSTVPQCMMQQHHQNDLRSHLLYILQKLHRDKSLNLLKKRIEQLEKSSFDKLVKAPDVRSLSFAIKDLEAKLGPLEEDTINECSEEGKVDEERKTKEVKIDGDGKVNKEVNITEEGKVNETGKVNEKGKVSDKGKASEEGKNNGRKVNEEGNVNQEGKLDDEKRVNEEWKTNEVGKVSGVGEVEEGEVHEEGQNNGRKVDEGIIRDEANVNKEGKFDGGKSNDEERVNEEMKDKVIMGGKVSEEQNEINEGLIYEAGKVNQEARVSEEGRVNEEKTSGVKVDEEGKVNAEEKSNEERWTNEVSQVNKEEKFNGGELIEASKDNEKEEVDEEQSRERENEFPNSCSRER